MTPANFYSLVLLPSCARLPAAMNTQQSRLMLMAIAGQESGWANRTQVGGPARGFWQFDMTAILDILAHPVCGPLAISACAMWDVPADPTTIYEAIAWHDPLACHMARLLLLADPAALPAIDDAADAYACYTRNWRPGVERPEAWPAIYAQALALVNVTTPPLTSAQRSAITQSMATVPTFQTAYSDLQMILQAILVSQEVTLEAQNATVVSIANLNQSITDAISASQQAIIQEIKTMSGTLADQINAAEAQLAADDATETAAITAETAAVQALVTAFQGVNVGSTITPAMLAAIQAADAQVNASTASVNTNTAAETAALTPVPTPTPTPAPTP